MRINKNHAPPVRFATIAHELGHLYLGHLGKEPARHIPGRAHVPDAQQELEAESVSYIVCSRNGVSSKVQTYPNPFAQGNHGRDLARTNPVALYWARSARPEGTTCKGGSTWSPVRRRSGLKCSTAGPRLGCSVSWRPQHAVRRPRPGIARASVPDPACTDTSVRRRQCRDAARP
jgi:hypothetical protein